MVKTELDDYIVNGIDEKNRRIFFGTRLIESSDTERVVHASTDLVIRAIHRMASSHPKTPIEIHMNTYGGDAYSMLGLYDVIQSSSCQIKFFGYGSIMSCGTFIMCGCDERYLMPNATVMIHNVSADQAGSTSELQIEMDEVNRLNKILHTIYANNSRMPKEFWESVCKRDLYLSAEEAIKLGLADRIVHPKKRGNLRKVRAAHLDNQLDNKTVKSLTDKLFKRIYAESPKNIVMTEPRKELSDDTITIESVKTEELNESGTE